MLNRSIRQDIVSASNDCVFSQILFGSQPLSSSAHARVRTLLKTTGWLQTDIDTLADDADLYAAGLTSHATVTLMLALEEAFDVEFPDSLLRRRTFSSVDAIVEALMEIDVDKEAV
jgi:acyl carrier protein